MLFKKRKFSKKTPQNQGRMCSCTNGRLNTGTPKRPANFQLPQKLPPSRGNQAHFIYFTFKCTFRGCFWNTN